MDMDGEVVFFDTQEEARRWFERNHGSAAEVWIGFYKKGSGRTAISYAEAVDEALCYGWIDGIRKTIDGTSYKNRFTPRKKGSTWSAVNIKRAGELIEMGRMRPAGLREFEKRDDERSRRYSYEQQNSALADEYEQQFRASPQAWDFFTAQPQGYRRSATWWVMSPKREETRLKRLGALIAGSERGERLTEITGKAGTQE